MIDKFQKLFGPNPPRGSEAEPQSAGVEPLQFTDALGDEAQKKRMQRIRNKRRILGFAAFVLAFLIAAPTFFEPDNTYADRTAKTLIPPLEDVKPAAVVKISQTEEAAKNQKDGTRKDRQGSRRKARAERKGRKARGRQKDGCRSLRDYGLGDRPLLHSDHRDRKPEVCA